MAATCALVVTDERSATAIVLWATAAFGHKSTPSDPTLLLAALVAIPGFLAFAVAAFCLGRPWRSARARALDPAGGARWKNAVARGMAWVARRRERAKARAWMRSPRGRLALERFHAPEPHRYFNESFYFNACDAGTGDRVVTRVSRHGVDGARRYVFLLVDSAAHGTLTLDEDGPAPPGGGGRARVEEGDAPRGLGLRYDADEAMPLQRVRVRYAGYMRRERAAGPARGGRPVPPAVYDTNTDDSDCSDGSKGGTDGTRTADGCDRVFVELDLVYENDTPTFWYMRDERPATLAENLAQEPWGYAFARYCLTRTKNHCHVEWYGRMKGTLLVRGARDRTRADGTAAAAAAAAAAAPGLYLLPSTFDGFAFRDHSWDVRRWAAIDALLILLLRLREPLVLPDGSRYFYLNVTLVSLPGNASGVCKFTTGWAAGCATDGPTRARGAVPPNVPVARASRLSDVLRACATDARGRRTPPDGPFAVRVELGDRAGTALAVRVAGGARRRLQYWPDGGEFEVFEDGTAAPTNGQKEAAAADAGPRCWVEVEGGAGMKLPAFGTVQFGFRTPRGDARYDPNDGGCG